MNTTIHFTVTARPQSALFHTIASGNAIGSKVGFKYGTNVPAGAIAMASEQSHSDLSESTSRAAINK